MLRGILTVLFCCCTQVFAQDIAYVTQSNIPYYSEAVRNSDEYIKERCVLDVYYPRGATNFATVVWFHGGGLSGGQKDIPRELKEKGVCVVAANYRLSPRVTASVCIEDAAQPPWPGSLTILSVLAEAVRASLFPAIRPADISLPW